MAIRGNMEANLHFLIEITNDEIIKTIAIQDPLLSQRRMVLIGLVTPDAAIIVTAKIIIEETVENVETSFVT